MLPELDLSRSVGPVDADVCLDVPGDENRRCPKASRHGLKLPQPASGVDESTPFPRWRFEMCQRRSVGVPRDESGDLRGGGVAQGRRLARFQSAANQLVFGVSRHP
jgi:hypothetical protein